MPRLSAIVMHRNRSGFSDSEEVSTDVLMINRHRFRPLRGGNHISSVSAGSDSQLGGAGPMVGAFIAGPIGALIGRVLAGTIEAVTSTKTAAASTRKKRVAKKAGLPGPKHAKAAAASPTPLPSKPEAGPAKPPRKRRGKKT